MHEGRIKGDNIISSLGFHFKSKLKQVRVVNTLGGVPRVIIAEVDSHLEVCFLLINASLRSFELPVLFKSGNARVVTNHDPPDSVASKQADNANH